jgi:hypothetical protein
MIRWQEIFVEPISDFEKITPIYNWCLTKFETELPVSAHLWYQIVFSPNPTGGWANCWRDSGFSLVHIHSNIVEDIKVDPSIYPNLLKRFPLYVVFYGREALTEFHLSWV